MIDAAHGSLLASYKVVVANIIIQEVDQTMNWTYLVGLRNYYKKCGLFFAGKTLIFKLYNKKREPFSVTIDMVDSYWAIIALYSSERVITTTKLQIS